MDIVAIFQQSKASVLKAFTLDGSIEIYMKIKNYVYSTTYQYFGDSLENSMKQFIDKYNLTPFD